MGSRTATARKGDGGSAGVAGTARLDGDRGHLARTVGTGGCGSGVGGRCREGYRRCGGVTASTGGDADAGYGTAGYGGSSCPGGCCDSRAVKPGPGSRGEITPDGAGVTGGCRQAGGCHGHGAVGESEHISCCGIGREGGEHQAGGLQASARDRNGLGGRSDGVSAAVHLEQQRGDGMVDDIGVELDRRRNSGGGVGRPAVDEDLAGGGVGVGKR